MAADGHPELRVERSGVAEADGMPTAAERQEARKHKHRVDELRAATRSGSKDAAVAWAQMLFPNGLGKPDHGPEHY